MTTTLVTGATGTVGFNIVKCLLNENRTVRVLVRNIEKAKQVLPIECEFVKGDVTDKKSIQAAMQGCDVVHHAAGLPEQWFKDPYVFTQVNEMGTQNMLDVALELNVDKFIYTSTIDVFAGKAHERYDESQLDEHDKGTYYERSKQKADRRVVGAMEKGLDVVFIHPAGVYGPGPDVAGAVGVNAIVSKVKQNDIPVLLPGGFPVVYSEDVGRAHVRAESMKSGERFILSEQYLTLTDLVAEIHKQLNIKRSVPKVMPVWVGKLIASVGELIAGVINKNPLIAKGELTFLQWQAIPNGQKATRDLDVNYMPFEQGLSNTIKLMPN